MNAPKSVEALSGPVSGMDTSSVAGVHCEQAGSHTGGLTPLERELLEALKDTVDSLEFTLRPRFDGWECSEETLLGKARSALAKAEAMATEAQHAGQWRPIESAPRDGTKIDLWLDSGRRAADVYWGEPDEDADSEFHEYGWLVGGEYARGEDEMPTHWQPLPAPPPAAPPSPAPPSSEREGSRAEDRS